ncbi:unnamed protein product [Rhizophagus irregularis]|uniref:Uncharacterized protein n=1 Tax=Rhizophagus irregularis TaxID=588596 RepID=A0A915YSL8_9GLOM|nr:unnamed protein product [Rhizophagus irregularis]
MNNIQKCLPSDVDCRVKMKLPSYFLVEQTRIMVKFSYGKGGNIRGNQAGPGVKDKWRHSLKKTSTLFKRLRSLK